MNVFSGNRAASLSWKTLLFLSVGAGTWTLLYNHFHSSWDVFPLQRSSRLVTRLITPWTVPKSPLSAFLVPCKMLIYRPCCPPCPGLVCFAKRRRKTHVAPLLPPPLPLPHLFACSLDTFLIWLCGSRTWRGRNKHLDGGNESVTTRNAFVSLHFCGSEAGFR